MPAPALRRKNIVIDQRKLRRARRVLKARTETETVDKALDQVLFGHEVMGSIVRVAGRAPDIEDVFGNLRERPR